MVDVTADLLPPPSAAGAKLDVSLRSGGGNAANGGDHGSGGGGGGIGRGGGGGGGGAANSIVYRVALPGGAPLPGPEEAHPGFIMAEVVMALEYDEAGGSGVAEV